MYFVSATLLTNYNPKKKRIFFMFKKNSCELKCFSFQTVSVSRVTESKKFF